MELNDRLEIQKDNKGNLNILIKNTDKKDCLLVDSVSLLEKCIEYDPKKFKKLLEIGYFKEYFTLDNFKREKVFYWFFLFLTSFFSIMFWYFILKKPFDIYIAILCYLGAFFSGFEIKKLFFKEIKNTHNKNTESNDKT